MNDSLGNTGRDFALAAHREINQLYDGYLPYEFHLRLVVKTGREFMRLVATDDHSVNIILNALWNHDCLEDTLRTYNDLKNVVGVDAAEIAYALTNEKGRSRKERANAWYYEGIRTTPYAVFCKLADRIANATYGRYIAADDRMYKMYQKEQADFEKNLAGEQLDALTPMLAHLRNVLRG